MPKQNNETRLGADDETFEEIELDDQTEGEDDEESNEDEVKGRLSRLEQSTAVTQLLSDPDIQAVINAKRNGKKVKVTDADDVKETDDDNDAEEEEEVDKDDPSTAILERLEKRLLKKLSPVTSRLDALEGLASSVQQKAAGDQVAKAKEKFPDFDRYRKTMVGLLKDNPGLNAEELYILAKARAGKLKIKEPSTFTERPTHQPKKPKKAVRESEEVGGTRRKRWNSALANALKDLDLGPER